MAKQCVNCGKKIQFSGTVYTLRYSKTAFCGNCNFEAMTIMDYFTNNQDKIKRDNLKEICNDKINNTSYNAEAKRLLNEEVSKRIEAITRKLAVEKREFNEAFDSILTKVNKAIDSFGIGIIDPVGEDNFAMGENRTKVMVFEQYYLRTSSYASLTVTIVGDDQKTSVSTIGAGGGTGIINLSLGAEKAFVREFWEYFESVNHE